MPRSLYRDRAQLVLELERQPPEPVVSNPRGLVEALADLLLEALGIEAAQTVGGAHDRQDHA